MLVGGVASPLPAQLTAPLDAATLGAFRWRQIGPANMGGRITDIEGVPSNPKVFYVAAASGGIWKTINGGTTFFPIFDKERVVSMGDIAVAPSNPNVIYAGTGEEDSRSSVSPGGGVYKSIDGGATWRLVGLEQTQHVGRIVVHATDPNTAYVAAVGRTWGFNRERGLYKTTDGGETWQVVKFVSERAGFVDVAMDPTDPNILYASSWERVRGPYFFRSGGPGSALWKTSDGGRTWVEVRGGGFPETMKGRIGIAIAPSNPQIVYAVVEADTAPNPLPRGATPDTTRRAQQPSGLYRSTDGAKTWTRMNGENGRPFYFSQLRVDPRNPDRVYQLAVRFRLSDDGGKTMRNGAIGIHIDFHAMWIDPNDPDHFIVGTDGGIAQTLDGGGTYDFINTVPLGQFYAVSYDMQKPYRVCGGLQDNSSWCGPSRSRDGLITNADWFVVGGGDGFYTAQDPIDPNIIYSEGPNGIIFRLDLATNISTLIRAESLSLGRFNWMTPFFLSPHAPRTVYAGGNRVIRSTDRGEHFLAISPDLSTRDSMRIAISMRTGGITRDRSGAETHGTITTLAESPIRPGILWAGTDDGNVWLGRHDGGVWENVTGRFPGVPPRTWVSRVEPSHFDSATVYITFDGHRENDFTPYVYASTDFGKSFRSVAGNLPTGGPDFVHVIREDPHNRNLLFVGTDVGVYASTDRGRVWQRFMTGMPTVPVHDLKIHPRERELIAGTHGRSVWIVDIAPLEELSDSIAQVAAHFFKPKIAYQYTPGSESGGGGQKTFRVRSPPYGAELVFRIGTSAGAPAQIVITDLEGDTVHVTGSAFGSPGIHRVFWDLRARPVLDAAAVRDSIRLARSLQQRRDSIARAPRDTARRDTVITRRRTAGPTTRSSAIGPGGINLRPAEEPPGDAPVGFFLPFVLGQPARRLHVEPGSYLATIIVNGHRMRQTITVERIGAVSDRSGEGAMKRFP